MKESIDDCFSRVSPMTFCRRIGVLVKGGETGDHCRETGVHRSLAAWRRSRGSEVEG